MVTSSWVWSNLNQASSSPFPKYYFQFITVHFLLFSFHLAGRQMHSRLQQHSLANVSICMEEKSCLVAAVASYFFPAIDFVHRITLLTFKQHSFANTQSNARTFSLALLLNFFFISFRSRLFSNSVDGRCSCGSRDCPLTLPLILFMPSLSLIICK